MNFLKGPEIGAVHKDIVTACDLLTRADKSNTALPVRVLYNLAAATPSVGGTRHNVNFSGSLSSATFSLMETFDNSGMWGMPDGDAFLKHIDQELQSEGITFTPKSQLWLKARNTP